MAGGRALLTSLTFASLTFASLCGCEGSSPPPATPSASTAPAVGSSSSPAASSAHEPALPTANVLGLDRSETQLGKAIAGRPALVTLWATWCEACRDELPALTKLDAWAKDRGAVVVGVAVGEPVARVSTYASAHRMPYMILVDEEFRFADTLGEKRVPTTLVVDRDGHIVYTGGAVDERSIAAFQRALAAASPNRVNAAAK